MQVKVEELKPNDVLSDDCKEQTSRGIVIEAYHTPTRTRKANGLSHYENARLVYSVRVARKYAYLTMATYGIVRVEKGTPVCVVARAVNSAPGVLGGTEK